MKTDICTYHATKQQHADINKIDLFHKILHTQAPDSIFFFKKVNKLPDNLLKMCSH